MLPMRKGAASLSTSALARFFGDRRIAAVENDGEFVATDSRAARARGRGSPGDIGDFAQQLVAGRMPVQIIDPLEVIEVEQEQDAAAAALERLGERAQQLAAVGQAGRRVGVGVAVRLSLGAFMGIERFAQILRAAPAEQDDRDVEEKGGLEAGAGRRQRRCRRSTAGTIWLPMPTNISIAASVAHVVMTWLAVSRAALLVTCFTLITFDGCPRLAYGANV